MCSHIEGSCASCGQAFTPKVLFAEGTNVSKATPVLLDVGARMKAVQAFEELESDK